MRKFKKLVVLDPLNVPHSYDDRIAECAEDVVFFDDIPESQDEVGRRIGDADAVLLNFTSSIGKEAIEQSPNLHYIGMASSLYSAQSANVDIAAAERKGITVVGVRDYGDEGVVEYVISELVRLLHGFGERRWRAEAWELTDVPIGIRGRGTTGTLGARGLHFFGADVSYYSRTRKPDVEEELDITYRSLDELLGQVDILCTCLNKNVVLLGEREFALWGDGKILLNTSIAPSHDMAALKTWLANESNYMLGDSIASIDPSGELLELPNVVCVHQSSGITTRAKQRLGDKVLQNMSSFLEKATTIQP